MRVFCFLCYFCLIKSWFYYVRDQNIICPWFLDFRPPGAPYSWILMYQKYFKTYKKIGTAFETSGFRKYENLECWCFGKCYAPTFLNCWELIFICFKNEHLEIEKTKTWEFERFEYLFFWISRIADVLSEFVKTGARKW